MYTSGSPEVDVSLELRKQLNFIIGSCRGYDEGRLEEGLRIAVALRVMFHQTRNSAALLGPHFVEKKLNLISTTMLDMSRPKGRRDALGFVGLFPSIGSFKPYIDTSKRNEQIPADAWWGTEPVMELLQEKTDEVVTRKQIILAAANQDGGAHVDQKKSAEYLRLSDGLSIEVVARFRDGVTRKVKLRHANLVALRQIAYEVLVSPDIKALAGGG
jgi:hypothetical protein